MPDVRRRRPPAAEVRVNQSRQSIDSAAFTHIDWRAASADDTNATLTVDFVFVPSTDEPIASFAHVWRKTSASE